MAALFFIFALLRVFLLAPESASANAVLIDTSVTATAATVILSQHDFRWYTNTNAVTPVTALAAVNTSAETPNAGTAVRLRMNVSADLLTLTSGATFALQYANSPLGTFTTVGTSTAWAFTDNASVADGQTLPSTLLGSSTIAESYSESNPTVGTPTTLAQNDRGEWDWALVNLSASPASQWVFRMAYSSGTLLDTYVRYPTFSAQTPPPPPGGGGGGGPVGVPPLIGGPLPFPYPPKKPPLALPDPLSILSMIDLNGDNRIDMADFSILLFYYGQSGSQIAFIDFNRDGIVDLADVSILLYYWTVS